MSNTPGVAQVFQADRLKFPALLPEETLVLRAWLALYESSYDRFDYNLRIGPGDDPGPSFNDATRRAAILNSQLRVDAVAWNGVQAGVVPPDATTPAPIYAAFPQAQATIIEVKRRAATAAATQLHAYSHVWQDQFPDAPPPDLILACNTYSQVILPALLADNIRLDVLQVDFSGLRLRKGK